MCFGKIPLLLCRVTDDSVIEIFSDTIQKSAKRNHSKATSLSGFLCFKFLDNFKTNGEHASISNEPFPSLTQHK